VEKPVLVGADLSEPSEEAIRQAHEWARRRDARLLICHVLPRALGPDLLLHDRIDPAHFEAQVAERLRAYAARITGRAPEEIEVLLDEGAADDVILRVAEERDVGLIVVGSHGQSRLGRVFLGDVAESVVRKARNPVLVARARPRSNAILVGTDFARPAMSALALAAEEARLRGARITLVTSIEPFMRTVFTMAEFGSAGDFVGGEYDEERDKARRQLGEVLKELGIEADILVTDGSPAGDLIEAAATLEASLVVLGAGKVAVKVARHAASSVLVVKES
jgi:nucleotide-binding universal stress UspA family protein